MGLLTRQGRCAAVGLLVVLTVGAARAQPISDDGRDLARSYEHLVWTTEDGLPQNTVNDIIQTRDGYLWLATFGGLARFDGVHFTVFDLATAPGLINNRIISLYEDRAGGLWIGHEDGAVTRYEAGDFTPFATGEDLTGYTVWAFAEQDDGTVWIATENGLVRVQAGTRTVFTEADGLPSAYINALLVDRMDVLWIGATVGLARYEAGKFTVFGPEAGLPGHSVQEIFEDRQGRLLVAAEGGVAVREGERFVPVVLPKSTGENLVYGSLGITEDARSRLWLTAFDEAMARWLYRVETVEGGATVQRRVSLLQTWTRVITRDREDNIWVGTMGEGLHRFREHPVRLFDAEDGLASKVTSRLVDDGAGGFWISAGPGEFWIIGECRDQTHFTDGAFVIKTTFKQEHPEACVDVLLRDRDGAVWFTIATKLYRHRDGQTRLILEGIADTDYLIRAIYQDRDGALWASGIRPGLSRLKDDALTTFTTADGLVHDNVGSIIQTHDGAIWAGTEDGISRLHEGTFTSYTAADGLAPGAVRALHQDDDGTLWIGTYGGGLSRIKDDQITHYTIEDGLFENIVSAILEDDEGNLWMLGNLGLFFVSRAELNAVAEGRLDRVTSVSYGAAEGMAEGEGGVQPSALRTQDGRMWFTTIAGLAMIDPNGGWRNEVPPPVVIEGVTLDEEPVPLEAPLVVPPGVERITFTYTGLSFPAPEKVRFRFRLDDYDAAWVEAGSRREASYTKLPPGSYTFRVLAANNDGIWSEVAAEISLIQRPYFYQTWWFYLLVGLVVGLLGYRGYRVRLKVRTAQLLAHKNAELEVANQQLQRAKEAAEIANLARSRFFANITHEFRTPLTLLIGPLKQALKDEKPARALTRERLGMMLRNSRQLLRLINQILDLTKLQTGHLEFDARPHDLAAFLRQTVRTLAPLAESEQITLTCTTLNQPSILLFDANHLEHVFTNLLSNAVKFTPSGGRIHVALYDEAEFVEVVVQDNGIGIDPDHLPFIFDRFYQADPSATRRHSGTGIGLALARELVALHEGTIEVESRPGHGSTFTIRLPKRPLDMAEPLVEDETDIPAEEQPPQTVQPRKHRRADHTTVLLVEDNADVRAYVHSLLEPTYRVLGAADGDHGLAHAREALPDLIIADVMMPGLDGLALSRALKEDPMTDCIPVILLTARAGTADQIKGLETGADAYVIKPFEADVLLAQVENLLALRRRLRKRFSQQALRPANPPPPTRSAFENRVREVILAHLTEADFTVEHLASEMALSRSQLHRKIRAEVGVSASQLIRTVRLEQAAQLLKDGAGLVSEVGYAVGFQSLSHFTRSFRDHFGIVPSAFAP